MSNGGTVARYKRELGGQAGCGFERAMPGREMRPTALPRAGDKIRILFLLPDLSGSGAERTLLSVRRHNIGNVSFSHHHLISKKRYAGQDRLPL
jgi:hypothetical protein